MEIGVLVILTVIGLAIVFGESTNTGKKFTEWGLKNLCGIDLNEVGD